MQKVKYGIIVLSLMIGSSILQYYFGPKETIFKEKIKLVEVTKTEVRSITRNEKRPDGTVITTTTKEDITESKKEELKETFKRVIPKSKDWIATVAVSTKEKYTVMVQRRIIADLYVGIYARTDKEIGAAISYSF